MSTILVKPNTPVTRLNLPDGDAWDPRSFEAFCLANPDVDAELDAQGNLVIMSPANADADNRNFDFNGQLAAWLKTRGDFVGFGPSAGFTLPNGAVRSPDSTVLRRTDWEGLTEEQRCSFAPLCPYFAMELRSSASDSLVDLQEKMQEYIDCGTQLGWLVDAIESELTVYRPSKAPVTLERPDKADASPELDGLVIDFGEIWPACPG